MSDVDTVAPNDHAMSPEIAAVIVDLTHRLNAAYVEADDAKADAAALREQRGILMQQLHEAGKTITRQTKRIAELCDANRALRAQAAEWEREAA